MRANLLTKPTLAATAALLLSGYNSCDPLIPNNGFDLWCDEQLCSWQVEEGTVARVPTWHEADYGVELIGNTVALSQVTDATSDQVDCIRFDLVADVAETATVTLEIDFFDDGTVDFERQIPTSEWAPVSYLVTPPRRYQAIRFRIRKRGSGRAVLAQIFAEDVDKCVEPPLEVGERPLGARCESAAQCASGLCGPDVSGLSAGGVCAGCADDPGCAGGEVCGAEAPGDATHLDYHLGCGPAGRHELGERCAVDQECATGVCCEGMCSTCCDGTGCDAGACARREVDEPFMWWWAPYQCGPATGGAGAGEPCLIDEDCAGGTCAGGDDLRVCELDGRACTGDQDCPGELHCIAVGTSGGTCA